MAINSLGSASKGMAGLASGMDTSSMVDAMLSGTQAKIDKQKANKAILGYKQTMYRNALSSLTGFQKNFLDPIGKNSLNVSSFYNSMTATSKSSAFRATATDNAPSGKTIINSISQLAKAAQIKTAAGMRVTGDVKGEIDLDKLAGQEIQVDLDGVRKTIKLPGAPTGGSMTNDEFRAAVQSSINKAFGNGITVGGTGSEITFSADTNREFVISGNSDAMNILGITTGASNKVNDSIDLSKLNLATPLAGDSFKFTINGEQFEFSSSDDLDKVISTINRSDANVNVRYSTLEDKFIMESTVSGKDVTIEMTQEEGNLLTAMFGVAAGGSYSSRQQVSYGDVTGSIGGIGGSYTPGDIISDENYMKIRDELDAVTAEINRATEDKDYKFELRIDDEIVEITIPKRQSTDPADPDAPLKEYTLADVVSTINNDAKVSAKGIAITLQEETDAGGVSTGRLTGQVLVEVPDGTKFETSDFAKSILGLPASNAKVAEGGDTFRSAGYDTAFDITLRDAGGAAMATIAITPDMTMDDVAAAIKTGLQAQGAGAGVDVTFDEDGSKGGFRIFGVDIPMTIDFGSEGKNLFGSEEIKFGQGNGHTYAETAGQNAKMQINGIDVERNSNQFTIDGMAYELRSTFNETNDPSKVEEIEVTRDTGKILDGIKLFMEEYNKIVEKTWQMLKEEAVYKEYPPLTDKQKEGMSDKEVELWEKKSQEGLMRGDKTLESIMNTMRDTMLTRPDGTKYNLADIGITTSYDIDKGIGGMLKFSDGGEEKLKNIIAQEPEEIEKLFSGNNGLIPELNKVIKGVSTVDTTGTVKYGNLSLANIAGTTGVPDASSKIYNQVRDINKNLESLNVKYKLEYTRYWKQFTSMEQMISQMNQQSSWLTQQFQ